MKKTVLFLLLLISSHMVFGQVCTGDFTFDTQEEVDAFLVNHPDCISIDGSIQLQQLPYNSNLNPITNLEAFQNIVSISGGLSIEVNADYQGFENLQHVGTELYLMPYPSSNINVFDGLQNAGSIVIDMAFISGEFVFSEIFPLITSLDNGFTLLAGSSEPFSFNGFHSLIQSEVIAFTSFGFTIQISEFNAFDNLQSAGSIAFHEVNISNLISGMENVMNISGFLAIAYADVSSMFNFDQLEYVYYMEIYSGSSSLPTLEFPQLVQAASTVSIRGSFSAISFPALTSTGPFFLQADSLTTEQTILSAPLLDSIHGELLLHNIGVSNLNGLSSLDYIGSTVSITHCSFLSNCAIAVMCAMVNANADSVFLEANASGCTTTDEVIASCSLQYLTGLVYADVNCDNVYNSGDFPIQHAIIHDLSNNPIGVSYANGEYGILIPENGSVDFHLQPIPGFNNAISYSADNSTNNDQGSFDFPLCPDTDYHDVSIYTVSYPQPRPGTFSLYELIGENLTINPESVTVVFDLSAMPGTTITSTNGIISGNQITWNFSGIAYQEYPEMYAWIYLDPSTALGSILTPTAHISLTAGIDNNPSNNTFTIDQTVIGSYDPNCKGVNRSAIEINEQSNAEGVWIDYTIQFQNTGTAEAINVRIEDTIEENLDLSTFQHLNASHPCELTFDENRKVLWWFNEIMLPDSNQNEPESHGFVHFRIKTLPGLSVDEIIENSAAIYFDFNEPIITNTATTILYQCIEELEITGPETVCENETLVLHANENWTNYVWTYNNSAYETGHSLSLTSLSPSSIEIILSAVMGYCHQSDSFALTVEATPAAPLITQVDNMLIASGSGEYYWTLDGTPLSSTSNTLEMTESGVYSVSVTTGMCSSTATSGEFAPVSVDEAQYDELICYPNPTQDRLNVNYPATWTGLNFVRVFDISGREIYNSTISNTPATLDMSAHDAGFYVLMIENQSSGKKLDIEFSKYE